MHVEESEGNIRKQDLIHTEKSGIAYYARRIRTAMRSDCSEDKDGCLTTAAIPLQAAFQLLGIFPISFCKKNCTLTHFWFSFPALHNLFFFIGNIVAIIIISRFLSKGLGKFRGTDSYTFVCVLASQFASTLVVFGAGNFKAPHFLFLKLFCTIIYLILR